MSSMLSVIAMIVSVVTFVVNYAEKKERRHGELVRLRTDIYARLCSICAVSANTVLQCLYVEQALRRINKLDKNDEMVKAFLDMKDGAVDTKEATVQLMKSIKGLDVDKDNCSKALVRMQFMASDLVLQEIEVRASERNVLSLLSNVETKGHL